MQANEGAGARRYNIVQPVWLSFFSKDLYRDVAHNWPGFGFVYLLLLLALAWVPPIVENHRGFAQFVGREGEAVVTQMPKITITNGQVSVDPPGPHYIKDEENGRVIIVIDTTADAGATEKYPGEIMLLTRTQLIMRQRDGQTRVQDLAAINSFSIDQAGMRRFLAFFKNALGFVAYPFALLVSYVYRIIQALLYGAIGLAFAGIVKTKLDYAATVRLAVIAVTPVIILDTLLGALSAKPPYWWLMCFVIAMGYLFFGVKSAAAAPPSSAVSPSSPVGPA